MDVVFAKGNWERSDWPLEKFLDAVVAGGFTAAEIYIPGRPESPGAICEALASRGLGLIAQMSTGGATAAEHLESLERSYLQAIACKPLLVSSHTGSDFFSFKDNSAIFAKGQELMARHGVPLVHETHRGRATFSATDTRRYLEAIPAMELTMDISHWFCVHESSLEGQDETLALAISRTRHVHGRVGFSEGPQVADPRAPEWKWWVDRHVVIWRRVLAHRRGQAGATLTVTPEFGPAPYMPMIPFENRPVADTWEVNVWMRQFLSEQLV